MKINPKVIDISHHNDVEYVDRKYTGFKKIRGAGYLGVINKASQGIKMVDPSYSIRRRPALEAGLFWGAYHYFNADDPKQQADHFLKAATPDDNTVMALDFEQPGTTLDQASVFMEFVKEKTGRYPWLYSGFLLKQQLSANRVDPYWFHINLWLAHYSEKPTWPRTWEKPTLWQFTGDGVGPAPHEVPGVKIPGGCDINSFDGTDDDLAAIWK